MKSSNKVCLALTSAALTLPGMVSERAHAQAVPEKTKVGYRYTSYQEGDQPANTLAAGAAERFNIDVHQFSVVAPVSSNVAVNVSAITETLSGASPWFIQAGPDGEAQVVMSGATIEENRDELNVGASIYEESTQQNFGLSYSKENDYESVGASMSSSLWMNENNTTLDWGLSASSDTIRPTQDAAVDPGRVAEEDKNRLTLFGGFSQVITKTTVVGANVSFANYEGFLSDPYKLVMINGAPGRDSRPDKRRQWAVDVKLRNYQPKIHSALHFDYRFYRDNWAITSHTITSGIYTDLWSWKLSGRLRYYSQVGASFYRDFYIAPRADGFYSSDYRLSGYAATSLRLGVSKKIAMFELFTNYEYYNSFDGSNPALVDFAMVTAGLDLNF